MAEHAEKKEEGGDEGGSPLWGMVGYYGGILVLLAFIGWLIITNVPAATSLLLLAIGIGGAISMLLFVWGFGVYIVRLGNDNRSAGIHIMMWAVSLLFFVVLCGGAVRLLEAYFA